MRVAGLIPAPIKQRLATAATLGFLSDWESFRVYNGILKTAPRGEGPFDVRIRHLGGKTVSLRPGTSDGRTAFSTFWHQFHLPPNELKLSANPVFFDLGANNGLTAAHLACAYPKARIFAVELDERNYLAAKHNTRAWQDTCTIFHGGVWFEDGEVSYMFSEGAEDGFGIDEVHPQGGEMVTVRSYSMESIFQEAGSPAIVDYVKMDIEGAERAVFTKNTEWAKKVRSIKVELHDYTHEECMDDLKKLGFECKKDTQHNLCVIGINRNI